MRLRRATLIELLDTTLWQMYGVESSPGPPKSPIADVRARTLSIT